MDGFVRKRDAHDIEQEMGMWNLRQRQHYWDMWRARDPWASLKNDTLTEVSNEMEEMDPRPPGPDPRPYKEKHPETWRQRVEAKLNLWLHRLHRNDAIRPDAQRELIEFERALGGGSFREKVPSAGRALEHKQFLVRRLDRKRDRYVKRVDKWAKRDPDSGYRKWMTYS
jgi:hypothetical protein